jgi:broad specificity phosphatase PhoE
VTAIRDEGMALRLLLIRHARTDWSRDRRLQGWHDVPLSDEGRAQAEAVGRALAERPIAAVYSSPLRRALDTAAAIAAPHRLEVQADVAFTEMGFGRWEGLTAHEIEVVDPHQYRLWVEAPAEAAPPGGERLADVQRRVLEGLGVLKARHRGQTVALVSHGISSRILVLEALGLQLDRLWSIALFATGVSELEFRDDWTAVHRMNTLVHLDALPVAH